MPCACAAATVPIAVAPRSPTTTATITTGSTHVTATTVVVDGAQGTAADRVGRCRAASVSPIGMVRGTSMEGGRATTGCNICGGRFGGLLFLALYPSS